MKSNRIIKNIKTNIQCMTIMKIELHLWPQLKLIHAIHGYKPLQNLWTYMKSNEHNASASRSNEINNNYEIIRNHIKINEHQWKFWISINVKENT